ncbi:MAG: hypothetical protein KC609_13985, partial [Myxococcales bacterium]|nr:hypothetical protein [Myxococcales bacterium]
MRIVLLILLLLLAGCVGSRRTFDLGDANNGADSCCNDGVTPTHDLSPTADGLVSSDTPGTNQCFGNRIIACSGESDCTTVEDCPFGCSGGVCNPFSCQPGTPTCSGTLAGTCSATGDGIENSTACSRRCSSGACCNTPTAVYLGETHLCAQFADDSTVCWGSNAVGELGNGKVSATISSPAPGLTALSGAKLRSLALGDAHTCVVLADGSVQCVGVNSDGQLGRGANSPYSPEWGPVINLESPMKLVAAAVRHSCAVSETGAVFCWGYNYSGQLGSGNYDNTNVPVPVVGLDAPVEKLAVSFDNTCAITEAGALYCWGKNNYGQLGIGITGAPNKATLVTSAVGRVVEVGIAADHMCLINDIGEVYCAGHNRNGQLGTGTD